MSSCTHKCKCQQRCFHVIFVVVEYIAYEEIWQLSPATNTWNMRHENILYAKSKLVCKCGTKQLADYLMCKIMWILTRFQKKLQLNSDKWCYVSWIVNNSVLIHTLSQILNSSFTPSCWAKFAEQCICFFYTSPKWSPICAGTVMVMKVTKTSAAAASADRLFQRRPLRWKNNNTGVQCAGHLRTGKKV